MTREMIQAAVLGALSAGTALLAILFLYLWWRYRRSYLLLWGLGFIAAFPMSATIRGFLFPASPPAVVGGFLLSQLTIDLLSTAGTARFLGIKVPGRAWAVAAVLLLPAPFLSLAGIRLPGQVPNAYWILHSSALALQGAWFLRRATPLANIATTLIFVLSLHSITYLFVVGSPVLIPLGVALGGTLSLLLGIVFGGLCLEEEREHALGTILAQNRRLETVNRELVDFVDILSHEIKTPLTLVKGYSELVRRAMEVHPDYGGTQQALRIVERSTRKAARVVEDLAAYALTGVSRDEPLLLDTREALAEAADMAERSAGRKPELAVGPLPKAILRPSILKNIFFHLLANAVRHSGSEKPIEVGCHLTEGHHKFFVRDHGKGLPPEVCERLFQPLVRGWDSRKMEGTGLGLAKVRKLVEAEGGDVWAEPTPGGGCTVWFSLPANPSPA